MSCHIRAKSIVKFIWHYPIQSTTFKVSTPKIKHGIWGSTSTLLGITVLIFPFPGFNWPFGHGFLNATVMTKIYDLTWPNEKKMNHTILRIIHCHHSQTQTIPLDNSRTRDWTLRTAKLVKHQRNSRCDENIHGKRPKSELNLIITLEPVTGSPGLYGWRNGRRSPILFFSSPTQIILVGFQFGEFVTCKMIDWFHNIINNLYLKRWWSSNSKNFLPRGRILCTTIILAVNVTSFQLAIFYIKVPNILLSGQMPILHAFVCHTTLIDVAISVQKGVKLTRPIPHPTLMLYVLSISG